MPALGLAVQPQPSRPSEMCTRRTGTGDCVTSLRGRTKAFTAAELLLIGDQGCAPSWQPKVPGMPRRQAALSRKSISFAAIETDAALLARRRTQSL